MPTRPGETPQNLCSAWSAPSFGNKVCTIAPGGWFGPVLEVMVQDRGMKGLVAKVPMISEHYQGTETGDGSPLDQDVWVNICCEDVQFATQEFRMGPDDSASASSADWPTLSELPSEALLYHLQTFCNWISQIRCEQYICPAGADSSTEVNDYAVQCIFLL